MGKAEDTVEERENWHWRNSMRPVRFFAMDARAAISFLLLLVYFRWVTFFLAVGSTIIFIALEKRGLTFVAALRNLRSWILGPNRPAWISLRRRRLVDYR
jgi:intracellular multiplication protein IcmT